MTIKDIIHIDDLEVYVKREFNKKCKDYSFGCYNCQIHRMLEDLKLFYEDCIEYEKDR
jgi:hypothetical protein